MCGLGALERAALCTIGCGRAADGNVSSYLSSADINEAITEQAFRVVHVIRRPDDDFADGDRCFRCRMRSWYRKLDKRNRRAMALSHSLNERLLRILDVDSAPLLLLCIGGMF